MVVAKRTRWWQATLAALGVLLATGAWADEVRVTSAEAVQRLVTELARAYERETGNTVALTFGSASVVRQKMAAQPTDVVILPDIAMNESARQGGILAASRRDIARSGMGVAVREGAPRPDISTVAAFRESLLAAKSIAYVDPAQGTTSGVHFASVLALLGVLEAMKPKSRLVAHGSPVELVASGEVELAAHQISQILSVRGVTLVGPLPAPLQKVTTYSAGVTTKSHAPALASTFIAFLGRPALRRKFAEAGLDYKD